MCVLFQSPRAMAALFIWCGFPGGSDRRICLQCGNPGLIPGSGRSPGEGNGNSLQYSCLKNSLDRGACGLDSPWGHKELDVTEWLTLIGPVALASLDSLLKMHNSQDFPGGPMAKTLQASHCRGFSYCTARVLALAGPVTVALGLSYPVPCGILVPGPGFETVSPVLDGGFLTTGPPGSPWRFYVVTTGAGRCAAVIWWVEARDAPDTPCSARGRPHQRTLQPKCQ